MLIKSACLLLYIIFFIPIYTKKKVKTNNYIKDRLQKELLMILFNEF